MQKRTKNTLKDILEPIELYLKKVDEEIKNNLKTGISIIDESALHLYRRGGKRIRASLTILSSGLKDRIPDDIIEVAAATETVHGAALIHDDIIDQSFLRRGDITVPQKWGNKVAVLIGDYMYTKALQLAVGEDRLDLFPEIVTAACEMIMGELYQIEYSSIDLINKEHYFNIIELKTAKFMAVCSKIGAIKANMSDEESDILFKFGLNLGMAYQIVDDTLDFSDDVEIVGKDFGNDFLNGKITLPFLHLLEISDNKEKELLTKYARNPNNDVWEIVKQKVGESGVIEYCVGVAEEWGKKAIAYMDYFPSSLYKEIMIELVSFLIERKY